MTTMTTIEKSELDKKSYRIIHLDNGLRAVLISDLKPGEKPAEDEAEPCADDEAGDACEDMDEDEGAGEDGPDDDGAAKPPPKKVQMSAAAICINAGSFHESNEVQGLAHYLEHMVFMGSEKYPSENDFDSFVSQRGGSYNAWTDCEMTLFYFDVHRRYFRESLDRFANFFVAPLLLADSMDREVTAVDSEFKMSLSQDAWRVEHFLGTLADTDHPYSFFMIGNVESLKTDPMSKGIDVYKNLQERRKRMYSAQYTTVAVQSKESLDDLEKLVRDILSGMPNNGKERPVVPLRNPFKNDRFQGKMYKIVPIKDIRKLIISWVLPPLKQHYRSRPYSIFGFLLGHEAKGSILSHLRKKNLAVALSAGCYGGGFELNECATMIRVEVHLTEEGLQRVDEVIEAVFHYCAILRQQGVPEAVFADMRQLAANGFRFEEEREPIDYVCSLAENLVRYPDEHLISGGKVYYDYDRELYKEALQHLVPHEANFLLLSMKHESKDNKVEKWYGVRYYEEAIPKEKLDRWMSVTPDEAIFHLPRKNEFIASDFKLIEHSDKYTKHPVTLDLPADCEGHGTLWYMQDTKFKMPKACVNARFLTPTFLDSPRHYVLSKIYVEILIQNLADITYDAEEANLRYDVMTGTSGVDLVVEGFNNKLFKLFTTVVDNMSEFVVAEEKFATCKEKVRQELVNYAYQPRRLYSDLQIWALYFKGALVPDLISLLHGVELQDLREFAAACWDPVHLLMYVHGNHTAAEAREYFVYTKKKLGLRPWKEIERQRCAEVPEGQTGVRVMNLNPCDVNTVVVDYYQVGAGELRLSVRVQLLNEILSEPCFNFLRTKETLGYAVWFRRFVSCGVLGMSVHVESQADKFTVDHCHGKMHEFIHEEAKDKLDKLEQKDFDMYVSSLIASKQVEDVNMGQPVRRHWDEICSDNLLFDRLEKEVALLRCVKKEDIMELYDRCFLKDTKRQLIFEVNALEVPKTSVSDEKIYSLPIKMDEAKSGDDAVKWVHDVAQLREGRKFHPYTRVV